MVIFEMARQGHGLALIPWLRLPWDPWTEEAVTILPESVGARVPAHLVLLRTLADTEAVRVMVEESRARQTRGGESDLSGGALDKPSGMFGGSGIIAT